MKKQGFRITGSELVALCAILAVLAVALVTKQSIFSPGALNAQAAQNAWGGVSSHADISGNCGACHAPPFSTDTMANRCLACHTAVADELTNPLSLHGVMFSDSKTLGCTYGCHTEHRGPNAPLILATVDHFTTKTAYSLKAHQVLSDGLPFTCVNCHVNGFNTFNQEICITCHRQIDAVFTQTHTDTFGTDCIKCHDGLDTYGKAFNHNRVQFLLTGNHITVACEGCHQGARTIADLKATPQDCYSCHQKDDTHKSLFGTGCAQCHNTADWKQATIDHSKTAFPLTGKHIALTCESCHQNARTIADMKATSQDCYSCHQKDDTHNGLYGKDCAQCHNAVDWKQATIDHAKTAFPLTLKHTGVPCASCHINGIYKGTPKDCYSCHQKDDTHKGLYGTDCAQCHNAVDWKQATIDHAKTAFPLTLKHTGVPCASCHINGIYKGTPKDCYSCHQKDDTHKGLYGTGCAQCHSAVDWKQATIDHSKTAYPLTGKHVTAACLLCHINGIFKGIAKDCYSCHKLKDLHLGSLGQNCAECHNTTGWTPAIYRRTHRFPINHESRVASPCKTCHPDTPKNYLTYTCYGCHEHTVTNIASRHRNTANLQDCIRSGCHPTGKGD
ncbi:MAG: hypothetical protein Q7J73_04475 [Dehalococcoidales bacterium]|nr:hypothetical protein [Dehalococcoidales bacterium]